MSERAGHNDKGVSAARLQDCFFDLLSTSVFDTLGVPNRL
jgi:hypothetical protein